MARPADLDRPLPRRSDPPPRRRSGGAALFAATAALTLALAGCSGSASTAADGGAMTATAGGAASAGGALAEGTDAAGTLAAAPAPQGGDAESGSAASGAATGASEALPVAAAVAPGDARQIIRTAELGVRLSVPTQGSTDADSTARRAALATAVADTRAAVVAADGVVASSDGSGDRTTLGLRIPVDVYDGTLDRLSGLGEVERRTESSQDVTAELVDVAGRIETMQASVDRVRALLAQATDIGQVVAIEGELAQREADLESLQRQQASLAGQVALSTVTLTLTAVTTGTGTGPVDQDEETGFLAGLSGGWSALLALLSGVGTAAGALLPFLPLVLAVGVVAWWVLRRRRRSAVPVAVSSSGPGPAPTG